MGIGTSIRNHTPLIGLAVGGAGAFGIQQWQSGDRAEEQSSTDAKVAESRAAGLDRRADEDLRERPSDRERDWDKVGALAVSGAVLAPAGLIVGLAEAGETAAGMRYPKGALVGFGAALVGVGAIGGALAGAGRNLWSDRFG